MDNEWTGAMTDTTDGVLMDRDFTGNLWRCFPPHFYWGIAMGFPPMVIK